MNPGADPGFARVFSTQMCILTWNELPTFDAEFKFAKIQNSHVWWGWGGGGGGLVEPNPNF